MSVRLNSSGMGVLGSLLLLALRGVGLNCDCVASLNGLDEDGWELLRINSIAPAPPPP